MKVATEFICPPIPVRSHDWTAYYPDLYDGAPDAGPQFVGYGETEEEALRDLADQISEDWLARGGRLAAATSVSRISGAQSSPPRLLCDDECASSCPLECGIDANRRRHEKEMLMGGIL